MASDELIMVREALDRLRSFPLPRGFSFRWHRPGDERVWVDIQAPFYVPGAVALDTFSRWFGTDVVAQSQRIAYLLDPAGRPIGTAAAWTYDGFRGPEWGRVHWVAIAQEYQGQGLGKSLLSIVLHRLVELGHTKAYLTTSTERPAAVALYRRFGFSPLT